MAKDISFKDAKTLVNYYSNLINSLKDRSLIGKRHSYSLNRQIDSLQFSGFFSSTAEKLLSGSNINLDDNQTMLLLSNTYYYMHGSNWSEMCKSLFDDNNMTVTKLIGEAQAATNPLTWLVASKAKKEAAISACNELISLKSASFVTISEDVITQIDSLPKTSSETIANDFLYNTEAFKNAALKSHRDAFTIGQVLQPIQQINSQLHNEERKISNVKASIDKNAENVKKAVELLVAEELLSELKNISVDELAKSRSGLKIKCLKDSGYTSLADIFGASREEIASIYGISEDASYTIKSICTDYAQQIHKGIKIKLNADNPTKAATQVVKAIGNYINMKGVIDKFNVLNNYGSTIENCITLLQEHKGNVSWLFMSDHEIEHLRHSYNTAKNTLENEYIPLTNEILNTHKKCTSASSKSAWEAFSENSIQYFNVIEELCPGVLGTDDSVYGLPEELAREIQDQCFFPDGLLCQLRKYQEWGVKYILHQERVLLGDEMGLGKTIQAIATMVSLKNTGASHFVVICPASVITNWQREINKHSRLRCIKVHGAGKASAVKAWIKNGGVAVTNYESASHFKLPDDFKFTLAVVDEAHYIKNPKARRSENTRNIAKHAERLLLMTGTALENNAEEMVSLIDVVNPTIASDIQGMTFMATAPEFRHRVAPVYYRRKREQVLTELPDKIETKEWCTLSGEEELLYEDAMLAHKFQEARRVSWNIDDLRKSSKATRMKEIIDEATADGRKVIVFSFFLDTIRSIHEFLKGQCLNPITGSVNVNRRQEILDEFNNSPAGTVLLAQITSGGTGLNIQSASVVIICEPQFKPSIENQAISRAYRMGQSRNVLVYRLLCENTIDEKLTDTLARKQEIFDAFADESVAAQQTEIDNRTFNNLIKEEIERIIKKRGLDASSIPTLDNIDATDSDDHEENTN